MQFGMISAKTDSETSEVCPLSTLKEHYEIVRDSEKFVTV